MVIGQSFPLSLDVVDVAAGLSSFGGSLGVGVSHGIFMAIQGFLISIFLALFIATEVGVVIMVEAEDMEGEVLQVSTFSWNPVLLKMGVEPDAPQEDTNAKIITNYFFYQLIQNPPKQSQRKKKRTTRQLRLRPLLHQHQHHRLHHHHLLLLRLPLPPLQLLQQRHHIISFLMLMLRKLPWRLLPPN